MIQEYSIQDKYQVFTIDLSNGLKDYEIDTMTISNFITTFYVDNNGNSINTGICNISVTAEKNYGLTFLNGSKYKGQYQKLYLNAPAQPNISIRVFTSIDAFYEKEMPVTNAVLTQPIEIASGNVDYDLYNNGDTLTANTLTTITIPTTLNSKTVKGINSILISNLSSSDSLYVGKGYTSSNYNKIATEIAPQEKLSIPFNPLCKSGFEFVLFSASAIDYQYSVLFTY